MSRPRRILEEPSRPLSFSVTDTEKAAIKLVADEMGLTVSDYLRRKLGLVTTAESSNHYGTAHKRRAVVGG